MPISILINHSPRSRNLPCQRFIQQSRHNNFRSREFLFFRITQPCTVFGKGTHVIRCSGLKVFQCDSQCLMRVYRLHPVIYRRRRSCSKTKAFTYYRRAAVFLYIGFYLDRGTRQVFQFTHYNLGNRNIQSDTFTFDLYIGNIHTIQTGRSIMYPGYINILIFIAVQADTAI